VAIVHVHKIEGYHHIIQVVAFWLLHVTYKMPNLFWVILLLNTKCIYQN